MAPVIGCFVAEWKDDNFFWRTGALLEYPRHYRGIQCAMIRVVNCESISNSVDEGSEGPTGVQCSTR